MKISHMIKREDFYYINEKTLKSFYQDAKKITPLYVYPRLNAIVTKKPSETVKNYLYTEYQVQGALWKKILVLLYCKIVLNSRGFLAAKRIIIPNYADNNTLIYPCNRKYRIFDFEANIVNVVPKYGFPTNELQQEIKFRINHNAEFLPSILSYNENGYSETIIDGYPVARSGIYVDEFSHKAYELWREYTISFDRLASGNAYAEVLKKDIDNEIINLKKISKKIDFCAVEKYASTVIQKLSQLDEILLTLSHGDLQAGNIWIERKTNKLLIIDWESCTERSIYYDQAVLFKKIRYTQGLKKTVAEKESKEKAIVLAEDLLYRLKELSSLPDQFGIKDFNDYLNEVETCYV